MAITSVRGGVVGNKKIEAPEKVHVYRNWCKTCGICIEFCPKKALGPDPDEYPELIDAEACNLCGLCELRCPDFAISVAKKPKKDKAAPAEKGND